MEAEVKQKEELKNLIEESRSRVLFCDDASNALGNALDELQTQHDNAKDLIQETFQVMKSSNQNNFFFFEILAEQP